MNDSSYILWWILCAIVGGAIGHMKGQVSVGVILGALLGPLGVIIALFLSDPHEQRALGQSPHKLRERLRAEAQQKKLLELQAQQPVQAPVPRVIVVNAAPHAQVVPPPPGAKALQNYRIASNGEELGVVPLATIRQMLHAGRLLETDHYFDAPANEWRTLDQLKDVF